MAKLPVILGNLDVTVDSVPPDVISKVYFHRVPFFWFRAGVWVLCRDNTERTSDLMRLQWERSANKQYYDSFYLMLMREVAILDFEVGEVGEVSKSEIGRPTSRDRLNAPLILETKILYWFFFKD